MQGVTSKVFVVTQQDFEYGGSKILALDTQSGNVLWQREVVLPASIITSRTHLYTTLYDKIEVVIHELGTWLTPNKFLRWGQFTMYLVQNLVYLRSRERKTPYL